MSELDKAPAEEKVEKEDTREVDLIGTDMIEKKIREHKVVFDKVIENKNQVSAQLDALTTQQIELQGAIKGLLGMLPKDKAEAISKELMGKK